MKNNLFHLLLATVSITGIASTANTAFAATLKTVSYSADTGINVLDYDSPLSIKQFDPKLGKLNSITLDLLGTVKGDGKFENRSSRPATVNVNVSALFSLFSPNNQNDPIIETQASSVRTYQVARFDGKVDYAGASGRSFQNLTSDVFNTKTLLDNSSLSMFTGTGNLNFLLSVISKSNVSGAGNISSEINTFGGGNLKVTYNYAQVPEPATLVGLATSLGLAALSTRKKASKDS